jgi:uncharacterized protein YkuJ
VIKVISDNTKQLYFELNGREVCGVAR